MKMYDTNWGDNVVLLAGTLRPETMYGQTNVWINNEGMYSAFTINDDGNKYIARYETFLNLCHQMDNVKLIKKDFVKGSELVGRAVKSAYTDRPLVIYSMGMVSMQKGTGIVTSVPTDSPTDYLYWKEFVKDDESLYPLEGIIQVGDTKVFAVDEIEKAKVKIGQGKKLDEVHDKVYMKEHTDGILLVGKYAGEKLSDAHDKIKSDMLEENLAMTYYEPSSQVISRTGAECVVAYCDQWYINYGDKDVTSRVDEHIVTKLNMFSNVAHDLIAKASEWIGMWPVSRDARFCLGTMLPVDERFIIDSLSDSTIYFAYYTVCNRVDKINIEDLTDDVWDYVFGQTEDKPSVYTRYSEIIDGMRSEFEYWYPLDLRVSGKDLISNHLTMALYNHEMIWPGKDYAPKSYFVNGWCMLNGEKMSKSTGNFLTIEETLEKYGADATRIALALSGDTISDANFNESTAAASINFLDTEFKWIKRFTEESTSDESKTDDYETKSDGECFWDHEFNERLIKFERNVRINIENMRFRDAFVEVYEIINARNAYASLHENTTIFENGTSRRMYQKYIVEYINLMIAVMDIFCPFWSANVREIVGYRDKVTWPRAKNSSYPESLWIADTVRDLATNIRNRHARVSKKEKKKYNLDIIVYSSFGETINSMVSDMMSEIENLSPESVKQWIVDHVKVAPKKDKAILGMFSKISFNGVRNYGSKWIEWIINPDINEISTLKSFIRELFHDIEFGEINITLNDEGCNKKYYPGANDFKLT
jgi:leucyl-tRNA synthetase